MTLEAMTPEQFSDALNLLDDEGAVSERSVAVLIRHALRRWGLCPRRAVLSHARDQLRAAKIEDTACVSRVLDRLVALRECDLAQVGHEQYVVPGEPRWLQVGEEVGAYLGVADLPEGIAVRTAQSADLVQRIRVGSDDDAALLQVAGVREVSLAEWLSPLGYLRHVARRLRQPVRSDAFTLAGFWDLLEAALASEGMPVSSDAEVRVVTGPPGQFFGRHDASEPEGRWTLQAPDGMWCASRRGHGDAQWHPVVLAVSGESRRALDLFDLDEWRWALLARGRRYGTEEEVQRVAEQVKLTFPGPWQLCAGMDLLGEQTGAWTWQLPPGAPDLWALLQ